MIQLKKYPFKLILIHLIILSSSLTSHLTLAFDTPTPLNGTCNNDSQCSIGTICGHNSQCRCRLGYIPNGTDCFQFRCHDDIECQPFGSHLICQLESNQTIGSCECSPIWPQLDHDSQQCLPERLLVIDIFVGLILVFALFGIFGVLLTGLKLCIPRRNEYQPLIDTYGQDK
ncbi:hypothetical protein BLOT_002015 [Blomia tropicalis]|nr:hypothetical protein BLOT_002015 [Blomia tropicalis]